MKTVLLLTLLSGTALSRTVSSCSCMFSFSARPNVQTWTLTGTSDCDRYRVEPTCVSWELPSSTSTPAPVEAVETAAPKLRKPDLKRAPEDVERHVKRQAQSTGNKAAPAATTSKTSSAPATTSSKKPTPTPTPTTSTSSSAAPSTTTSKTSTTSTSTTSSACNPTPTRSSGKRGVLYNSTPLTNLFSVTCSASRSKVNWAANWYSADATDGNPGSYNPALTFIPMLWSGAPVLTSVWNSNALAAINAGADSLLSFNEPDGCGGGSACMSVSDAVANYTQFMNPLASKAKLGAPSVTNSIAPGEGLNWLSTFFQQCSGLCHVDFVAIHWYGDAGQVTDFQNYVYNAYQQFGLPLQITEFGLTSGSEAAIENFLKVNLPWLDQQTYVQRYGLYWAAPGQLVTGDGSSLSTTGQIYNSY